MTIVEDTLNNSVIPLNIIEAEVIAAIDENVHLDCVYFLFRREPHVWVRLLSGPGNNNNNDDDGGGDDDSDDDENDNDVNDDNEGGDEGEGAGNHNDEDHDNDD